MWGVGENDIIINITKAIIIAQNKNLYNFLELLLRFFGMLMTFVYDYMVSKLLINIPAPAMIINGGAMMDSAGGRVPVDPSALNIFIKKYTAKHVMIPKLNFIPKL